MKYTIEVIGKILNVLSIQSIGGDTPSRGFSWYLV